MFAEAWAATVRHAHPSAVGNLGAAAVLRAYAPLLAHVGAAAELRDLLGEMTAELGASHAYIAPPEPTADAVAGQQGFLGADVAWDGAAGGWRVRRLLRGDAWDALGAAPLGAPAAAVAEGALLRAINGTPLTRALPPELALRRLAGREVSRAARARVMPPCSHAALQPCSRAALRPCGPTALPPCNLQPGARARASIPTRPLLQPWSHPAALGPPCNRRSS